MVNRYFETISLQKGLDKLLIDFPAAVIQVTLGLVLLAFYHPVFIAFGLLLLFIVLLIRRLTSSKGLQTAMLASNYKYQVAGWLQELARTVKSFKYTKGTSLHIQKTDESVSNYLDSRTKYFKILLTQFWSLVSFKVIITAAMLIVGAYLLVNQQINIGQFIAADIVIIAIIGSIEKLITNLDSIYEALVSVEKLSDITEAEKEHSGNLTLPSKNERVSIQFNNISFAYSNEVPVLNNINFNITQGQIVHLKGASGAGKSTVLRLLDGTYTAYNGSMLRDGIPVANYDLQSLRNRTGILLGSQDIFYGTLLQNITMGNETISIEKVKDMAKLVGLNTFVDFSKNGYDAVLLPVGNKLSNNVRKNILLIRTLLGAQRLLLLENPFDHLEEPFKNNVMQYIKENKTTTVIIASEDEQLSRYCDKVLTINQYGEMFN
jgi:ATP-binding cassette subfamily B protein